MAKITQALKDQGQLPENAVVTLELRPKRRRQADESRNQEVVVIINTPVDKTNPDALTNDQIIENEGNSIAGVLNGTVTKSEGELFPGTRQEQSVVKPEVTTESEASTTTSTTTAKSEEPVTEATQAPVSSTQATDGSDGSSAAFTLMSLYFTGFLLC